MSRKMHSSLFIYTLLAACCAATDHAPQEADVKTTFLTLTKPCTTTTSAVVAQDTHVWYEPVVKEVCTPSTSSYAVYTPKVEAKSTSYVVEEVTYTPPVVKHETWTTPVVVKHETWTPPVEVKSYDVYTPKIKVEEYTSTTHVVTEATYTPPAKHETWTPPVEVKSYAIYTPKVKVEEYTSTTHVVTEVAYTPPVQHETSTAPPVEQKNTETPPVKHDTSTSTYVLYTNYTTSSYAPEKTQAVYSSYAPTVKQDTSSPYYPTTTTPPVVVKHTTTTLEIVHPPATKQDTPTPTYAYTYFPSAACTCPTETSSPEPTYLPSLPLKAESVQAFDSLLSIILSIPDAILDAGDEAVTTFYTNLSTCVGSKGETLKQSFIEFGTIFGGIAGNIEEEISKGAKEVEEFIGGLVEKGKDVVEDVGDAVEDVGDVVEDVGSAVTSAVGPVVSDILNSISTVSKTRRQAEALSSITEIISGIDSLRACLSSAISTNPVFEVAKCAASIASVAFPAARVLKVKGLIGAAGGQVKTLKALANAKDVAGLGKEVLDVLGEISGISDIVNDCKFIVE